MSDEERYRDEFRDQRVLITGGNGRHESRRALKAYFGFRKVDWLSDTRNAPRKVESAARRVASGHYTTVFLLASFSKHHVQSALKRGFAQRDDNDGEFIVVPHGHGVAAFIRGIDLARGVDVE